MRAKADARSVRPGVSVTQALFLFQIWYSLGENPTNTEYQFILNMKMASGPITAIKKAYNKISF